jgi:serine/threonine-protein kinase Stk1
MSGDWKRWEGQVVDGSFRLQRFLGSGEQGAVFLTQCGDPEPRNAAIKLVEADSPEAELQLARWERAAQLAHPHLIRMFRSGSCRANQTGLIYAVMEYAEEDVATVLTERPLTVAEAGEMLEPVLDALTYLHGQGLAHGHLKPANIMAVSDQLKISCDGIRRVNELGGIPRKPGMYDPPERQSGESSPSGDVWSLGVTLVEALTQRLPLPAGPTGDVVLPEALPAVFLEVVRRCLQADPRKRATLPEIAAWLHQRSPEASRRSRYLVPAVGVGLALAAILVGPRLIRHPVPPTTLPQPAVQSGPAPKAADPRPPEAPPKPTEHFTGGQVLHQVLPDIPRQARETIRGKVRVGVRVSVDPSGHVVNSKLDSVGPSRYFAGLTLEAARHWEFRPPTVGGRDVSSEWILRFELTNQATAVRSVRVSP